MNYFILELGKTGSNAIKIQFPCKGLILYVPMSVGLGLTLQIRCIRTSQFEIKIFFLTFVGC